MPSVPLSFFFVALVILLGFITSRLFLTTRVPDIPILLSIGLLIGPLNAELFHNAFLSDSFNIEFFKGVAPFLSTLALIVILFDSGLKLDFDQFGGGMRPAFLHTIPLFVLTVGATAAIAIWVLGMPVLIAVVLGVALSNVGQTVSAALIREFNIRPEVRSVYFIEMALYDLVSIPLLVALLDFIEGSGGVEDVGVFLQSLARVMSVSLVVGIAGGLLWIYIQSRLDNYPYTYMITLALLLFVYSLNSFVGGSGPVAVLIFGLVVGNRTAVLRALRKRIDIKAEGERVHTFHDEITFFIRSFYFVFLGITFSTGVKGGWNVFARVPGLSSFNGTGTLFLIGSLLIVLAIIGIRYVVVRFVSARANPERMSLWAIYGRGLGTAVLATFPFTLAAYQDRSSAYYALFQPYEGLFTNIALVIILLTVLGSSITAMLEERRMGLQRPARPRREPEAAKE